MTRDKIESEEITLDKGAECMDARRHMALLRSALSLRTTAINISLLRSENLGSHLTNQMFKRASLAGREVASEIVIVDDVLFIV